MKRSILLGSILTLLLTGCGGPATVRIGFIGPLTGDAATMGKDTLKGVQMAVDEMNAAGGIGGKQVELIAEDGRCNGGDAASAAQKLVNVDKVQSIIGGTCSSETLAAAPIAGAAKIIAISPVSSSPKLTGFSPYQFRNYPSDAYRTKAFGTFFQKNGLKKIAIITENTDFCQGIRSGIKENLPAGAIIAFDEVVDPGTKDYRTLMTRLKATDFDAFVLNGQSDATNGEMAKQLRALGMTQTIIGPDSVDSDSFPVIAGSASEGVLAISAPTVDETNPKGAAFAKTYNDRFGKPTWSLYFAALAYDAATVALQTLKEAGPGDAQRAALLAIKDFQGVAGTFHFDQNGDVVGMPYGLKEFKNGKSVLREVIPVN